MVRFSECISDHWTGAWILTGIKNGYFQGTVKDGTAQKLLKVRKLSKNFTYLGNYNNHLHFEGAIQRLPKLK